MYIPGVLLGKQEIYTLLHMGHIGGTLRELHKGYKSKLSHLDMIYDLQSAVQEIYTLLHTVPLWKVEQQLRAGARRPQGPRSEAPVARSRLRV